VCVAIGELAESLDINLDAVPKKYEGLDGTELAISESQERMAVVLDAGDVQKFLDYAQEENLEATLVATVTPGRRLRMFWNEDCIVDISRDFLDTNGAPQQADATVTVPCGVPFFDREIEVLKNNGGDRAAAWKENLTGLNVCSQKGLVERFDASIGAGTVLMPFGGKYQLTPNEAMAAKIPLMEGETDTATLMAHGYDPDLSSYSPYHGAMYAVIHSLAKIACAGGDYAKARLTMQEYFQRMTEDPTGWGKPMAALLGAYEAQKRMGTPGIGGKDSMSGTFNDVSVPPTLVSIAVGIAKASQIGSPEFKQADGAVALLPVLPGADGMIDFEALKANLERVGQLVRQGQVQAAATVGQGGAAAAVSKMAFGNHIGFELAEGVDDKALFMPYYGSVVLAFAPGADVEQALKGLDWRMLGQTIDAQEIRLEGQTL
ncbi:AIR synthase-related protein, partial [[Clostridium] scindens]|uniref:AIR synthase-related protein n=1 Tax=Clostridium scindens (strain JCM 10418 / VPI 12708) TaxID=29347 RepID=UPI0034A160A0